MIIIKKYLYAAWEIIIATRNLWVVPLVVLKIKKEAVIRIKSKPKEMSILINSNNYQALFDMLLLRKKGNLVFDGTKIRFPPCEVELLPEQITENEISIIREACTHNLFLEKYKGQYLVRLNDRIKFIVGKGSQVSNLFEIFVLNQYQRFYQNLNGKVVVDIGASIGDTPISFSQNGAEIVYAYEPDHDLCNIMMNNLRLNGISNVKLFNVGISSLSEKIASKASLRPDTVIYDLIPLSDAVKKAGKVDFLKMDCEGFEFPALLSLTKECLTNIGEMVIEYHKNPNPIVKKLKNAGFLVKLEKPWTYEKGYPIGFLHAKKQN